MRSFDCSLPLRQRNIDLVKIPAASYPDSHLRIAWRGIRAPSLYGIRLVFWRLYSEPESWRVDDFVAIKALSFNKIQQRSKRARNENKANHLESPNFRRVQQGLESGSGPGGRRFKSSLPDHSFQPVNLVNWHSFICPTLHNRLRLTEKIGYLLPAFQSVGCFFLRWSFRHQNRVACVWTGVICVGVEHSASSFATELTRALTA